MVQRLFGTDRLLALAIKPLHVNDMQNTERNLNYALLLKSCLDTVPELESILATGVHPFFVKMRKVRAFSRFNVIRSRRAYNGFALAEFRKFRIPSYEGQDFNADTRGREIREGMHFPEYAAVLRYKSRYQRIAGRRPANLLRVNQRHEK